MGWWHLGDTIDTIIIIIIIGDRAFPVAAYRLSNTLPQNVTSASSVFVF